jgi:dienelactone hydrolase
MQAAGSGTRARGVNPAKSSNPVVINNVRIFDGVADQLKNRRCLKAAGVPHELIVIPGVDHVFIGKTPDETREANLKALDATFRFIDKPWETVTRKGQSQIRSRHGTFGREKRMLVRENFRTL